MNEDVLSHRLEEFHRHVWNHAEDPFQLQFDEARVIDSEIESALIALAKFASTHRDEEIIQEIKNCIGRLGIEFFEVILQFCGLTRTKIITDLKSMTIDSSKRIPSSYKSLPSSNVWPLAGRYIIKKIKPILVAINSGNSANIIRALNYATWPGWIRQERAKRSGHEAEGRLARALSEVGIPFEPKEKAKNPLCKDVDIYGESFDIVIPSVDNPQICIKSTVHTANIGQYGESKDYLEIASAKAILEENFKESERPILLALIDGLGFYSNKEGLEGILKKSDEFCQFSTLWKVIIIANSKLDEPLDICIYLLDEDPTEFTDFFSKYNFSPDRILSERPIGNVEQIEIGRSIIVIKDRPEPPAVGLDRFK